MSQTSESGARASEWGHRCARELAARLGASEPRGNSNECELDGERVVLKCAHAKTDSVGVTYLMLGRVDAVVAAFEAEEGGYDVWRLPSDVYRGEMTATRSRGPSAGKVGQVKRKVFQARGSFLGRVTISADV